MLVKTSSVAACDDHRMGLPAVSVCYELRLIAACETGKGPYTMVEWSRSPTMFATLPWCWGSVFLCMQEEANANF
jgi:hypothetical protein